MKELIGKELVVGIEGRDIKGKMIADYKDRIVLASPFDDDKSKSIVATIVKSKITYFMLSENKTVEKLKEIGSNITGIPLTVLACCNKGIKCNGVRLFVTKSVDALTKEDYDQFMSPCPKKQKSCKCGPMGSLLDIPVPNLIEMLEGTLIGEYPQ